jgi:hypothetical protein
MPSSSWHLLRCFWDNDAIHLLRCFLWNMALIKFVVDSSSRNVLSYGLQRIVLHYSILMYYWCSVIQLTVVAVKINNVANSLQQMSYFTGCGCLPKQSIVIYSSANFARLQAGPVDFAGRRLVLGRLDKRRVVTDINIYSVLWTIRLVFISLWFSCYQSSFDACHHWRNRSREIPHRRPSCMLQCALYWEGTFAWSGFVPLVLTSCWYVSSERKDGEGNRNSPN